MLPPFIRNTRRKAGKKRGIFSERTIFPIVSAKALLSSLKREKILEEIKEIVQAPEKHYRYLYENLINNFVEFVQITPVHNEARLGSLMDEGLLRGLFALQALKQESGKDETEPLMKYMIFSASLLFDIGFVTCDRSINIVDKKGSLIEVWHPHEGPVNLRGEYYKIRRNGGMPPWLSRRFTSLLARQIMPIKGFDWIARDSYSLNAWLALLNNEYEGIESLRIYLDRAINMLEDFKVQHDFNNMAINIDVIESKDLDWGEEFLEWLREAILDGSLSINEWESSIHVVQEGLFLELPGVFAEFCKRHPKAPDYDVVIGQFKELGFVEVVDGDVKTNRYFFNTSKLSSEKIQAIKSQVGKVSLFKKTIGSKQAEKFSTDVKVDISDSHSRNLAISGWRSGILLNGPNAGCLLDGINISSMSVSDHMQGMSDIHDSSEVDLSPLQASYPSIPLSSNQANIVSPNHIIEK